MFTPSLMLLSKSSSTTPPAPDLNRRERSEQRIPFPFPLFAPVGFLLRVFIDWLLERMSRLLPISDFHLVEIDRQTDRHVKQFHVAHKLGPMNRQNLLNSFGFHQHAWGLDFNRSEQ